MPALLTSLRLRTCGETDRGRGGTRMRAGVEEAGGGRLLMCCDWSWQGRWLWMCWLRLELLQRQTDCNVKLEVLGNERKKSFGCRVRAWAHRTKPSRVNYQEKSADPCIVTTNRLMSHSQSSTSVEIVIFF